MRGANDEKNLDIPKAIGEELSPMNRNVLRPLIIVIVLGLALGSLGVSNAPRASAEFKSAQSKAAQGPCPSVQEVNADAALEKLKAGNLRWQSKMEERNWAEERKETAE